ncbi:MAG: hypothetical protein Q8N52_01810, partial [Acidobacteriota bacterium]|nr:hypothetical protein [Acidobacteriota bacterium]
DALGGLSRTSRERLVDWLTEGMAEYIAYSTMIRLGEMRSADVDAFMLSSAVVTGQAASCLVTLEGSSSSLWPGHIGFFAVKTLIDRSPHGLRSLRMVSEALGARATFEQAFEQAFGLTKQAFYDLFPAHVAGLGGPSSCR